MQQVYRSVRTAVFIGLTLWLFTVAAVAAQDAQHKELAKQVEAILARPDVARGFWGVEIEELETGSVVYSRDADRLFVPASNAKLFTTAATLALIGPNYRFRTTVESATGPDKYGRLSGDLVLVGRGDPNLSGRTLPFSLKTERALPPTYVLDQLVDQLIARGVKVIDGDLIADDSFFVYERYGEGWSVGDLLWQTGAPVSALAVNDNVVYVNISPGERPGERAFINVAPFAEYYHIDNRVLTSPPGTGTHRLGVQRELGSNQIEIWGTIPQDDPGVSEALAIQEPAEFCARLFSELLAKRGVVLYGRTRARHLVVESFGAPVAAAVTPSPISQPLVLAEHLSQPLGLDVAVTNKVSQNLHAEMMLRLLGREKGTIPSVAGGLAVLRGFLTQAGVGPDEYALYDGSGLSRQNLVSPRATVKLLRYAAQQNWGAQYIDSLPLAGVDGTLSARFTELPAAAILRAKTGSLDHVKALSGYLTTATGHRLVFSIYCNNHTLASGEAYDVMDEILREAERLQN
jgi:D-alanyl-D-alanine carboxypeptidase/D-alanyl-D-alanine-endopeptidase (penicillin-binding protein 4)